MNKNCFRFSAARHKWILLALLGLNLILKLLLFYNTNSFTVSEARSNYNFLKAIDGGKNPSLFESNYRSILAYIGHLFKSVTGTLDAFFWFQAVLGTVALCIFYLICMRLTKDRPASLFALVLATILMDYHLLTPVFYYQVFDIFFVLLVIYLVLIAMDGGKLASLTALLFVPVIVYLSNFFRSTLWYFWVLLLVMSFYFILKKEYQRFISFAAAAILIILLVSILPYSKFRNSNTQSSNDFKFFGHTLYGGDGGEGIFIYKENEARYEKRLKEFMREHHYDSLTIQVRNKFQSREIKEFISKTPHKWFWLQVRKVAYTFGIVPVRDSLELLTTGKLPLKWYLSAFIIQAPFVIILLGFIVLFVLFFKVSDLNNGKFLFLMLALLYLIASTCLYGHYQERYRHVVILAGILPVAAFYFSKYFSRSSQKTIKNRRYILLVLILIIIFSHWGYQAYEVLVIHKERYVKAINQF